MMPFDSFILLAGMRTGSNLLEANLNQLDGVTCHGEAFNPSFVGAPKTEKLLGFSMSDREVDPFALLSAIRDSDTIGGFRYFHDHDPRILGTCVDDPSCAKIILTRNPVDSFVSWKIAQATGQWKLTNATHAKALLIRFDENDFNAHLEATQAFHTRVSRALQISGQTAFHIRYEDLRDLDVLNGLAAFLGVSDRLPQVNKRLKKQNPGPTVEKVSNPDDLKQAILRQDWFDLSRTPYLEPQRGPAIPSYLATSGSGLLFMPMRSGPSQAVKRWMAAVDGCTPQELLEGFNQTSLKQWQRVHIPHRAFTVIRHPVARAHVAFCERIVFAGPKCLGELRANLRRVHRMPIPENPISALGGAGYGATEHRTAFLAFLKFLKANLSGQTSIRVDASWSTQAALLQGMAQFKVPDLIIRERDAEKDLMQLTHALGIKAQPFGTSTHTQHELLLSIYDKQIEQAARDAYERDYSAFGYGDLGSFPV